MLSFLEWALLILQVESDLLPPNCSIYNVTWSLHKLRLLSTVVLSYTGAPWWLTGVEMKKVPSLVADYM